MLTGQTRGSERTAAAAPRISAVFVSVLSRFCLGVVSVLSRFCLGFVSVLPPTSPKLPITQRVALSVQIGNR